MIGPLEILFIVIIALIVGSLGISTVIIVRAIGQLNTTNIKKLEDQIHSNRLLMIQLQEHRIDFSKHYIEYLKFLVAQTAVMEFKQFQDTHDIRTATKSQVAQVVDQTARKTKNAIQFEKIDFNNAMFTQRYLDDLIINAAMMNIKKLLENAVNNYEE